MMNYFLPLASCLLLLASDLSAQVIGGELVKLEELFDKGKFEDCAYKAETYSENEKYAKNPEPYLYISMCYYEFHFSEDVKIKEYYKSALKDALKYAVKMKGYDKEEIFTMTTKSIWTNFARPVWKKQKRWLIKKITAKHHRITTNRW
jgi:hypothetical protein